LRAFFGGAANIAGAHSELLSIRRFATPAQ
jgi:hypothetical protein